MFRFLSGEEAGLGPGSEIRDGDEVVVYQSYDNMRAVSVDSTKKFNCKYGAFDMSSWVGRPFGSKVLASDNSGGFVYLLAPTPELWTQVLKHRTQILYAADISLITSYLELRPGCTVLESGTGSGSLTHALARAVAPSGHVHTFEFHEGRCEEARREFEGHGLAEVVSLQHRDIEQFGFPEALHGQADAVFLDLPGPWKVVESAASCLREDGVFCSFSPCIEQVQKTCGALSKAGFYSVRTMECLLRQYEVRSMVLQTDVLSAAVPSGAGQKRKRGREAQAEDPSNQTVIARPQMTARGHTGYLTFARRIVQEDGEELLGPGPEAEEPVQE